jgi:hypothetical protein
MSRNGHVQVVALTLKLRSPTPSDATPRFSIARSFCLDDDGRSSFHKLLFRREWPFFFAFDLLEIDGRDLHQLPQTERKRHLERIMPKVESRVRCVGHIEATGKKFFDLACAEDLEGRCRQVEVRHLPPQRSADLLGEDKEPDLLPAVR